MRIQFKEDKQREFIKKVLTNLGCPSLRSLKQHGIEINYQTLKSYYSEERTLPESLFNDLCKLAKLNNENFQFKIINENWGQTLGGKTTQSFNTEKI